MYKKSQISYFVLFAIIILIAVGFILYINNNKKVEEFKEPETQAIQLFVESCIKDTGKDSILFVSEHGGYYNLPNLHYSFFGLNVPYYFYQNIPFNPAKAEIEKQISDYINDNIFFCLRNFVDFRKLGYNIRFGNIYTKTNIAPNKAVYDVKIPIELRKENTIKNLEEFRVELDNIGLDKIIKINNLILKEQSKDHSSICLSCIINWTIEFDLRVEMNRLEDNVILFMVIDNNTIIGDTTLTFNFVNQYETFSCSNLPPDDTDFIQQCIQQQIENLTSELKIDEIPDFNVKVGELFWYDVNATGKNVVFEDFTDLFDMNPTSGVISFIPQNESVGENQVWIKAKDIFGNEKYRTFIVNIKNE